MHLTHQTDGAAPHSAASVGTAQRKPVLIGIDWGSSNLRVALLDAQGGLIERRESPAGVFTVKDGGFAAALLPLCSDWLAQHRVPLLACGMIGSRQGIADVPYVTCPASVNDLAQQLGCVELPPLRGSATDPVGDLYIVPGLNTGSPATGWDVMRGEETQLFGPARRSCPFVCVARHPFEMDAPQPQRPDRVVSDLHDR